MPIGRLPVCLAAAIGLLALAAARGSAAADAAKAALRSLPIVFTADQFSYDSATRIVEARGNVEASQGGRVLKADTVTYDQARDLLRAQGNVALTEPGGEVAFARSAEITGDLKDGVIEDLKAILANGSRIAAASGRRADGLITDFDRAVYSPCALCPDQPERPPLWQVKAVKVRHDRTEKIVEFSEAQMEIEGVPVFYIPYFYQPDPTVTRKTGLLVPTFANSSDFGAIIQLPVFVTLSPQADMTLTPWFTTKEGPVIEAEYRQALKHGAVEIDGSLTRDSQQKTRGHVIGTSRYDIDESWRAGLDVRRSIDRTYLRRYDFGDQETLLSRAFTESFAENRYFAANAYLFQGLDDDDDNDQIPVVAPKLDYAYTSGLDPLGGRTDVHLDFASFSRVEGADTQRLSARANWRLPMVGEVGELYTLSAGLWGDGYYASNFKPEAGADAIDGFTGRLIPQAAIQARLPFVRDGARFQQVIEPIAEAAISPLAGNSRRIPDEDSQDIELDDTNVFGFQRFDGLDRVDEGPRLNYGVAWSLFGEDDRRASVFAGQVYHFVDDRVFPEGSGLENNLSDLVTAVDLQPDPLVDLTYRNRIDVARAAARRHELQGRLGPKTLRLGASYVRYDSDPEAGFAKREEVDFGLVSQIDRYWRTRISGARDLTEDGSWRELGIRFTYEDECFLFTVGYAREDIEDRDIKPRDVVFVRLGFKTIGDVGAGFGSRQGG
jgi:LPS-assembly protein